MIKERLKRLVSVVAAAAIAISALCAPIGAEAKKYTYLINLDADGNIVSQYNADEASVDLTTPMEPLAFIKEGKNIVKCQRFILGKSYRLPSGVEEAGTMV